MKKLTLITLSKKYYILIATATVLYSLLVFSGILVKPALNFLSGISNKMLISVGIAVELKSIATSISDYNIPLLQNTANEISDIFDTTIQYLMISNILISVQVVITVLGKSLIFKIIPLLLLTGVFIKQYSQMSVKLLIIALMITPGLSVYVNSVHLISKSLQLDLGISLHNDLTSLKERYDNKISALEKKEKEKKETQTEKAEEKGKSEIGVVTKISDTVIDDLEHIGLRAKEGFSIVLNTLKDGKKQILQMAINLISNLIVLFVLLPLLYFYLINFVLKKFFHFSMLKQIDAIEDENFNELEEEIEEKME